jgi:hypothetical protein
MRIITCLDLSAIACGDEVVSATFHGLGLAQWMRVFRAVILKRVKALLPQFVNGR